ncbi:MAG: sulfatase-like hydrolase/transferase, partial [Verrucomicrobiota bacterium]
MLPVSHGVNSFIGHTGGCIDFFTMTYGIIPDWYHNTKHVGENGYATELITEEAVDFLSQRSEGDAPFFLYLAYNAPHFGKGYSPSDKKPVNLMQPQAADLKRVEFIEDKIRREFAAMTVSLDDGIGKVLESLKENDLEKNTWVIFLTDHGGDPTYGGSNLPLRGDKATLFEGGLKVPCVMRWPGKVEPGIVSDAVVSSLDFFPSFCEAAGITETLPLHDGTSLFPILKGEPGNNTRQLLWQTGAHAELGRKSWLALRDGPLKYLSSPQEGEFLFNLEADPNETLNLRETQPNDFFRLKETALKRARVLRQSANQ